MSLRDVARALVPSRLAPLLARIENSPVGVRLARGTFWVLASEVLSKLVALGSSIALARILGRDGFGEFGMVQSTLGMFGAFAGFGMGLTATKHVAELRRSDPARAGRVMALSAVVSAATGAAMALALALLAPVVAEKTLAAPHLAAPLRVAALMLLIGAVSHAQASALLGFEAFGTGAMLNLIHSLCLLVFAAGGGYMWGLTGAVGGLVAAGALSCAANRIALGRVAAGSRVPVGLAGWTRELGLVWSFSLPMALSGMLAGPVEWASRAFLVNGPGGYGEMAVFTAAGQWAHTLRILPSSIAYPTVTVLSELHGQGDMRRFRKVLRSSLLASGAAGAAVAAVVLPLSPWILRSYGPGFEGGTGVLAVLVAASLMIVLASPLAQAVTSAGMAWPRLGITLAWAASLVGASALLVPRLGALGLAAATAAGGGVMLSVLALIVRYPVSQQLRRSSRGCPPTTRDGPGRL